jgi:hypothetical protein
MSEFGTVFATNPIGSPKLSNYFPYLGIKKLP